MPTAYTSARGVISVGIFMPFSRNLLKGVFIMKRENTSIREIQNKIGYEFRNTDLMFQAFIRKSYSEENGGENNEVLEFIGDKVLDLAVVKILSEKYGKVTNGDIANGKLDIFCCECTEGELTEKKRKLVEKKYLAKRMEELDFAKYLIMSKGDLENNLHHSYSVMEDLFEALIGAVALDSNWNFNEIQNVVKFMLDLDNYIDNDNDNYISLIQEWSLKKYGELPEYLARHLERNETPYPLIHKSNEIVSKRAYNGEMQVIDISKMRKCKLNLKDIPYTFIGYGNSTSDAKKDVCKLAFEYLKKENLLLSIKDEIENPNKKDAINQLEILARRGYFSIPQYNFQQKYDNDGNPIWICKCSVAEYDKFFSTKQSSKKDAKKETAYKMLKYVLNN